MNDQGSLEKEWVSQAQNGEMAAFGRLVTLHQKAVFGFIQSLLRDEALADELTQDTFVKAWRGITRFRAESAFQTWLFQIALNTVRSWSRWKALRRLREISLHFMGERQDDESGSPIEQMPGSPAESDPVCAIENKELGRKIEAAISKLPSREKEVFILRHYQDKPLKEIAEIMGIAEGSVKAHLSHVLEKLRRSMEKDDER